jgi:hypothetical protein
VKFLLTLLALTSFAVAIGCSNTADRTQVTVEELRRQLESMEPENEEADRLREFIATIEGSSGRRIAPFIYRAHLIAFSRNGEQRRDGLSIQWVDPDRMIVECEIRYADNNVRYPIKPDGLIGSEGIHLLHMVWVDEIMSDTDISELRNAAKSGDATVVLFGKSGPTNAVKISPVKDPLSE